MFMSFSKNKFTLLWQNSVTDVSVGFRPPCWSIQLSTSMASPSKNLYCWFSHNVTKIQTTKL